MEWSPHLKKICKNHRRKFTGGTTKGISNVSSGFHCRNQAVTPRQAQRLQHQSVAQTATWDGDDSGFSNDSWPFNLARNMVLKMVKKNNVPKYVYLSLS